jgi:hypothetical protein
MPLMPASTKRPTRAPRYVLSAPEPVMVTLGPSNKLGARLHALSLTGGRMKLAKPLAVGTFADITMTTVSGPFTAPIETLKPLAGGVQPFRFVQIDPGYRKRLETTLKKLEEQGLGESHPGLFSLLSGLTKRLTGKSK